MADGLEDTKVLPASPHPLDTAAAFRTPSLRGAVAYTEEEGVAILEAERVGKPHPFSDREKQRIRSV